MLEWIDNIVIKILFFLNKISRRIRLRFFGFSLIRKIHWTNQYNKAVNILIDKEFVFMNLGYADLSAKFDENSFKDISQVHRFSEQLYKHVVGNIELENKEVLEVGCGRGGGSAYIMQQYKPKRLIAVDIAKKAIKSCKEVHKMSGIIFQTADAMSLPFPDRSFDAVINVESSHCYPSLEGFCREVTRVLRPGGVFLYADLIAYHLNKLTLDQIKKKISESGFIIINEEDISMNVLKSRDILTESGLFEKALNKWINKNINKYRLKIISTSLKRSFYLKGTPSYNSLKNGVFAYWSWKLQKPM